MTIAEEIVEKVRVLPEDKQKEVLRFVREMEVEARPQQRLKIFERIDEITRRVPDESWAELPADGAERVDDYLYGTPERK